MEKAGNRLLRNKRTSPEHIDLSSTMKVILYALLASFASAFAPQGSVRQTTHLYENFGLPYAEDSYANQDPLIGGEANYKQFVNRVNENNMLNRKVCDCLVS